MNRQHKPIRVLHVHGDLVAGGGQTLSRECLRAADRSEIDPFAVVLNEPITLRESFEKAGISVTYMPGSKISQIFKLAKYIRENNIDVVHTQSEEDRKVGHWAALIAKKPVVAHLHSEWVYFAKPSEAKGLVNKLRAFLVFTQRKISERSVVHFVATSELVKKAFAPHTKRPITTVEPGVAISELTAEQKVKYREALNISDDEFVIVNLSRLDSAKNLSDFVKTVSVLAKTQKVRSYIAGEGPLRDEISREIASAGLFREVELLHALDNPLDILGAADVFLATSEYESFGISVLEALSVGLPVVGYDLEVYDRYNGAVRAVPLGDVDGLTKECLALANSDTRKAQMRQQALKAAEKYCISNGTKILTGIDKMYVTNKSGVN